MNREQKQAAVVEIAAKIREADAIYAVDYRGITVTQAASLRSSLREADASFRVVKNTLTVLAADKAGVEQVKELVEGPTAFTFVYGDPALAAKALDSFSRQQNVLEVRGGLMEGQLIDADTFRRLARLPGRDQLNAQFAGMVASPLTGLVRGLNSLLAGLAAALGQLSEKKGAQEPVEPPPPDAAEPEGERQEQPEASSEGQTDTEQQAADEQQAETSGEEQADTQEQTGREQAEQDEKEADQ